LRVMRRYVAAVVALLTASCGDSTGPTFETHFDLTDPAGDTLGAGTSGIPAHDVVSFRGDFSGDSLIVTLTFVAPVAPGTSTASNAMGGFIELDIDDNAATGDSPISNFFGASANLGVDYVLDLFVATPTSAEVFPTANVQSTVMVPASFNGTIVEVRIPMSALGNDDGRFALVGTIGIFERATDIFPNSGQTTARSVGATAQSWENLSRMPSLTEPNAASRQEIWRTRFEIRRRATK
jgi:hypothetical protein